MKMIVVENTYYIDKNIKTIEENYTVGIIICKQDNEYVIKYCSDDRIISREYELIWYNKKKENLYGNKTRWYCKSWT